jgi:hypothetical protein
MPMCRPTAGRSCSSNERRDPASPSITGIRRAAHCRTRPSAGRNLMTPVDRLTGQFIECYVLAGLVFGLGKLALAVLTLPLRARAAGRRAPSALTSPRRQRSAGQRNPPPPSLTATQESPVPPGGDPGMPTDGRGGELPHRSECSEGHAASSPSSTATLESPGQIRGGHHEMTTNDRGGEWPLQTFIQDATPWVHSID